MVISGNTATVNGKTYSIDVKEGTESCSKSGFRCPKYSSKGPLPGLVLRINVSVGDEVTNGQELLVLEAMKMETPINSPGSENNFHRGKPG